MKKSKKKLAVAALLAGSVAISATSCNRNVCVYGPPEEVHTQDRENSTTSASNTGSTTEGFVPDDNMNEDVYGPPADPE